MRLLQPPTGNPGIEITTTAYLMNPEHYSDAPATQRGKVVSRYLLAIALLLVAAVLPGIAQTDPRIAWIRGGQVATVSDIALSGSGDTLVSAAPDGIRVWDVKSHLLLSKHPVTGVTCIAVSPSATVAYGGIELTLHRLDDGTLLRHFPEVRGPIQHLSFSHDATLLAITASFSDRIVIWDMVNNRELSHLDLPGETVVMAAFSPVGNTVVVSTESGRVVIWESSTGEVSRDYPPRLRRVHTAAFSHDGKQIVVGSDDPSVEIIDIATDSVVWSNHDIGVTYSAAFSPDGSYLALGAEAGSIMLVQLSTGLVGELGPILGSVVQVAFSPDSRVLTGAFDLAGNIVDWNMDDFQIRDFYTDFIGGAERVAFSSDGHLVAASTIRNVFVYSARSGERVGEMSTALTSTYGLAFSNDNRWLVAGSDDSKLRVWDVLNLNDDAEVIDIGFRVSNIEFSPDGTLIAISGRHRVSVRHVGSWEEDFAFESDTVAQDVSFSRDGRLIVTSGGDGVVRIWDVVSHDLVQELYDHTDHVFSAAFGCNDSLIVSGGVDGTVRIWRWRESLIVNRYQHSDVVTGVAFIGDCRLVASSSWDGSVVVRRLSDYSMSAVLDAYPAFPISATAFTADGSMAAVAGSDAVVVYATGLPGIGSVSSSAVAGSEKHHISIAPVGNSSRFQITMETPDGCGPAGSSVTADLYGVSTGRFIRSFTLPCRDGRYRVEFDASDLPSGAYVLRSISLGSSQGAMFLVTR